jgi:putative flavoprotein involved in K+ transport
VTRGLDGADVPVVVIGGGQAGLSASYCLAGRGVEHLVLERSRLFWEWRNRRWDSFCLVTPNWQCQLPGHPYAGADPDGFMVLDEVLAYLDGYVAATAPPVHEGVEVRRLGRAGRGGFDVVTDAGTLHAGQVVIATGPYNVPLTPRVAADLPAGLTQVHSGDYRRPAALPPGAVLVIGTGQSGCQIAEDLHLAGRRVHLATGSAPRVARRYRGKDVVKWLDEMGTYATTVADHPLGEEKRRNVNHYVTGRDGGHDLDLRVFATEGMELYGRLSDVDGAVLRFAGDLAANLDGADAVAESIKDSIDAWIDKHDLDAPTEARRAPVWHPPRGPRELDLQAAGVGSVVWCTGFRAEYGWVDLPVFDDNGRPRHTRGVTDVAGAYFLGLPWLHTWGSARFSGVGADAEHVASVAAALVAGVPAAADAGPLAASTAAPAGRSV